MLDQKQNDELNAIAKQMVAPGKGILAADESMGSIEKKFAKINLPSTEESRQAYRDMFFTTPGIEEFISGVILFDETIRQKAVDGTPFVQLLERKAVLPGIKVDQGLEPMTDSPDEKVTKGLEGLADRFKEYAALGGKFAKWRAELAVSDILPTDKSIQENNRRLAQYAKFSQEAGIVPMVEPEVMMNGENTMERCAEVSEKVLTSLFEELEKAGVALEGTILKTNMSIPGQKSGQTATPEQIAEATLRVYNKTVPKNIPGIVFLSGGQSSTEATRNLNAVTKMGSQPWPISFSFGRALQDDALKAWQGKSENLAAGQKAFYHRLKMNGLALQGKYSEELENQA